MKTSAATLVLALACACAFLLPSSASGYAAPGAFRCYKVKDTLGNNKYTLDDTTFGGVTGLGAVQPPDIVENGCEVQVPPKQACFPVYAYPGGSNPPPGGAFWVQAQARPMLCYKIKCDTTTPLAKDAPPVAGLKDDMGSHTLTLKGAKGKSLCIPACALAAQPCWSPDQCCSGNCASSVCM